MTPPTGRSNDLDADVPLDRRVIEVLERHPAVQRVRLIGSRAAGTAVALSDWDFAIETQDFGAVGRDIRGLLAAFHLWHSSGIV